MKRIYIIFLIFATVMFGMLQVVAQAPMNWTLVNTGTTKNIRDISFINRDTGFIAGDDGLLKMTTNGGAVWIDMSIPSAGQGAGNNNNIKVAQFVNNFGNVNGVLFFEKFTSINRLYGLPGTWNLECGGPLFAQHDSICSINNYHRNNTYTEYTAGGNCLEGGGTFGYFGGFCFTFDSLRGDTSFAGWADVSDDVHGNVILVGADGYYAKGTPFNMNVLHNALGYDYLSVDWSDTTTIYAANNSGGWLLEKSTNGGNSFVVDSTVQPTFWYPVVAEMDFTDNDWGVMACASNITGGLIITKRGNNVDFFGTDTILTSSFVLDSTYAFAGGLGGKLYKYDPAATASIEPGVENVDFTIFPNPQNAGADVLNVRVDAEVKQVVIYDIMGQVIVNQTVNQQGNIQIHTGIKTVGTYVVRLFTNQGVGTKKYVVN
jgi:hypothetical protein